MTTARDIMHPNPTTVSPEQGVLEAVRCLVKKGYSGAPVVDAGGQLVGILSERDCIAALAAAAFHDSPEESVAQRMSERPLTVAPDVDVFRLAMLFVEHPFRRVPVVEGGRVVGLVARRDLMAALSHLSDRTHSHTEVYDAIAGRRGIHNPLSDAG